MAAAAAMTIESVHDHAISAIYYYVDLATLDARLRSTAQAACREDAAAPRGHRGGPDPRPRRGGSLATSPIR